ncbi:MAG: amidohydrolase family protein [Chloroflexi bacterium]|nr:amidohydrolase family protein [Chloroflexota bacterium]
MQRESVDTIVHGGQVVTASQAFDAAVAIKGEKIVAVGDATTLPRATNYIDAKGKYVLPGAIDAHVHLRPTPGDDWSVGPRAAAHAGITTIIPFGGDRGARQGGLADAASRLIEEASAQSVVDFGLHFMMPYVPSAIQDLPAAMRLGVTSFKLFMTFGRASDSHIARTMETVGANGGVVQLHCENGEVIEYLQQKAIAERRVHPREYPATCPTWAEAEAINRAILLGAMTGCPTYVVHLSTKAGLERIKQAQSAGQRVWVETCPQYLLLNEKEMERLGPLAKIGPPLRPADGVNQEAMWQGSRDGYISNVASDHAPHARERKEPGWQNIFVGPDDQSIPQGAPSMETMVPLMYSEGVVKRGLPIWWMARVLSENPARIFGLYPRKGVIQPGADADLLIIDPNAERTIRARALHSTTGYTPYEGWTVKGQPWMTLLRGGVLLNQGELEQKPGYGRFMTGGPPTPPIAGSVS